MSKILGFILEKYKEKKKLFKKTITFNQCGGHFPFYYRILFQEGVILNFKTLWNSVNILFIDAEEVGI